MSRYEGTDPPIGSYGVILHGGLRFAYTDVPMSGELLKDSPNCPEWVQDGTVYWVRHAIGGAVILGPVLRVEHKDASNP